jgi:D-galactonate transporter
MRTSAAAVPASEVEESAYRKVSLRIMPFLMICYVVAYLDRVNVGFAKLQMLSDLKFSEAVYGLGAGMFFIGYFFFEVPSNLAMQKVGAKIWIARIMITWGIISGCFAFVSTEFWFYVLRFLLGAAEAGFYPGIILYLTYWYPSYRRARKVALFMTAIPLSGVFGGPLSGWIMESFSGVRGLNGWQWMFIIEAIPAILLGIGTIFYLDNGIRSAKWLSEEQKDILERHIAEEDRHKVEHPSLLALFSDMRVWHMSAIYFAFVMGQYGLTFWLPTLIKSAGVQGVLDIGLLTAIPYITAVVAMVLIGASADRNRERRWHLIIPCLIGAAGLTASALAAQNTTLAIVALCFAASGILTCAPLFWSLPTAFLAGTSAAAGIAAVNSVGNLAGFVSPFVVGWVKDVTQSTDIGLYILSGTLVVGAILVYLTPPKLVNEPAASPVTQAGLAAERRAAVPR